MTSGEVLVGWFLTRCEHGSGLVVDTSTLLRRRRATFPAILCGSSFRADDDLTFSNEPKLNLRRRFLDVGSAGVNGVGDREPRGVGGSETAVKVNCTVELARPPDDVSTVTQPTHGRHATVVQTSLSDEMYRTLSTTSDPHMNSPTTSSRLSPKSRPRTVTTVPPVVGASAGHTSTMRGHETWDSSSVGSEERLT